MLCIVYNTEKYIVMFIVKCIKYFVIKSVKFIV